jgi:hypothetical protein
MNNCNIYAYLFEGIMEVVGEKKSGIESGCIMKDISYNNSPKYLVKDMDFNSIISEFVGSRITRFIIDQIESKDQVEMVPLVDLILDKNNKAYVRSKYIENFLSLDDYRTKNDIPLACYPNGCNNDNGKITPIVLITNFSQLYPNTTYQVQQAASLNIYAELVFHGDHHGVNRGVTRKEEETRAASIDFSLSLKDSDKIIYYNSNYYLDELINAFKKVLSIPPTAIFNEIDILFKDIKAKFPCADLQYKHNYINEIISHRIELFKQEVQSLSLFKKLLSAVYDAEQGDMQSLLSLELNDLINYQINDLRGTDVQVTPIKMNLVEALLKISPPKQSEVIDYFTSNSELLPFLGDFSVPN